MTKEELLKERYKMIADYPGSPCYVGDILTFEGSKIVEMFVNGQNADADFIIAAEIIKYPHLFRKLEWWEERPEGELPQYLKSISVALSMKIGEVCKVRKYAADIKNAGVFLEGKSFSRLIETLVPSDEEEYNAYISQKQ